MLLSALLKGSSAGCCSAATDAVLAGGWAAAGQQRAKHFIPVLVKGEDGGFDAEDTHATWKAVWRAPRARAPPPPTPSLDPEESRLLQQAAMQAGLPRGAARRVVAGVRHGYLPYDPLLLTQRIQGLGQLLGGAAGGAAGAEAAARLLSGPEGPSLLSVPPHRLARQVALLRRLLPRYEPAWLLTAAPRWAAHGPAHVARRLEDLEALYSTHLGVEFPRRLLGDPRERWRWLFTLSPRTKKINALQLILKAGPHTAAELLQACPRLLTVRPQQLGETLDALQACLGAASPRDAAALVAARPPVLMRPPVAVAAAASALVDLVGGDAAAAREMVAAHPGVLLGDGEGFEATLQQLAQLTGIGGSGGGGEGASSSGAGDGGDAGASREQLPDLVRAAPQLLTRPADALAASWAALCHVAAAPGGGDSGDASASGGGGVPLARRLVTPPSGDPRLLALSAAELEARGAALDRLASVSDAWRARAGAARADARQLAAVLGAPAPAAARVAWLVASDQRLAPGGTSLVDLVRMSDAAFRDIYPQWAQSAP